MAYESGPENAAGWYGSPPQTIANDTQVVRGGKRSLRFDRTAESPGTFSFVARDLPLDFDSKTIELRGWLKREGEGLASRWLRQDDEKETIAFVDMGANPAVSSTWEQHSISFDVKEGARKLVIGVRLIGVGKAWADDLELRVDGVPLPALPDTPVDVPAREMRTSARLAASNCTGEVSLTSGSLAAALRAVVRAAGAGATSCFKPSPSLDVPSPARLIAGASDNVSASETPIRASNAPRTRHSLRFMLVAPCWFRFGASSSEPAPKWTAEATPAPSPVQ